MKTLKFAFEINWPLQIQGQKTKCRESKERKIKATKTISLVLLRKGPESIAHWRRRTVRRRFLDCLIETNWISTLSCLIFCSDLYLVTVFFGLQINSSKINLPDFSLDCKYEITVQYLFHNGMAFKIKISLEAQKTKIRESKERKIKARATKTISLVLLRKGPESIAHWRRFLDCLIKTNWTSTPICSITLISSYALCYIFRSISLLYIQTRWNIFKSSGDKSIW